MVADDERPAGFSLRRWSQRKLEATRASDPLPGAPPPQLAAPAAVAPATAAPAAAANAGGATAAPELPPVESLTFDSDFTAFLQPKVDEALRRQALRTLFRDPRFNVMDGLDVYIDDYSKPDPISPELVRQLVQSRYIFDPPKTRVNADGHVEEVPPEDALAAALPPEEPSPAAPDSADPHTEDATHAAGDGPVDTGDEPNAPKSQA
jgi:hypothetical protein